MAKPLEEYTDDELIEELKKRHDQFVCAGSKNDTKDEGNAYSDWSGDPFKCQGLASQAVFDIAVEINEMRHKKG